MVDYVYDAWGNVAVIDSNGNDVESGIGVLNPFRYRGYYYDTETELYYLQTRYYDPELGRFISQDSIEYADPETINGLNLYAYCGNNPVMYTDPNGTWNWGIFASIVTLVASVAAVIAGLILTATGVGAPVGAILLGAGVGSLFGMGGSVLSQAWYKGWDNINWGQVALNGGTGALIGGCMASPLGPVATGIFIGIVAFGESVGNDLFDKGFNWQEVDWGQAIITGVLMGTVSGFGKIFVNVGNDLAEIPGNGFPSSKDVQATGKFLSRTAKLITAGLRFVLKSLSKLINF